MIQSGDIAGTLHSAAFGVRYEKNVLNVHLTSRLLKENVLFFLLNFPTPNILLGLCGLGVLRRVAPTRGFAILVLALWVLFGAFASRYTVVDRYAFFIPFYVMCSVFVGLGAKSFILDKNRRLWAYLMVIFVLLPIPVYAAAPAIGERWGVNVGVRRKIPYRDNYRYFLQPWRSGYDGAEQFANEAFDVAEANAAIYADSTTACPLLYVQEVKGRRPDVKIISGISAGENAPVFDEQAVEELLKDRPLYVVWPKAGYCPAFLLDGYAFAQRGVLWQVVSRAKKAG